MRALAILTMICVFPGTVLAGACDDLWFTRNLIMDRAGFCFASPLGQALFDNADCAGTNNVPVSPQDQVTINRLREIEVGLTCQVDTNRTWIDLPDINFRKVLTSHPILDELALGWGCNGWTGPVTPLYYGYSAPLHPIGQIAPGDFVSFLHISGVENWSYVTSHSHNYSALKSAGWLYWPGEKPCTEIAG